MQIIDCLRRRAAARLAFERLERFEDDPDQSPMYQIHAFGACLRCFARPLSWPYLFHRYGFYGFGAGPFGFMLWPPPDESLAQGGRMDAAARQRLK